MVSRGEGAKTSCDDGHRAELGSGGIDHIGAGGVLLAVVTIATLQVVVGASDGDLHARGRRSTSR